MASIAVFPGSFDPFTIGHQHIATRALSMFGEVVIAIGNNVDKQAMFTPQERKAGIEAIFVHEPRIKVSIYSGLTIDFCQSVGAKFIVRGLRSPADFEHEMHIAQANQMMDSGIETVFLLAHPSDSGVSSTLVRDVLANGGKALPFLPNANLTNNNYPKTI
ncbi:phosphopantetheine adenylyltransferase [Bacteroidia bacterium]|nr:phosphopantetheine adenylyltransferase [Bacteroidia bacterium]